MATFEASGASAERTAAERLVDLLPKLLEQAVIGNRETIAADALQVGTVKSWRRSNATKAGLTAGACACGPLVIGAILSSGAFLYMIRRIARTCLGIGVIMQVKLDPESDLLAILALWAGLRKREVLNALRVARRSARAAYPYALGIAGLSTTSIGGSLLREMVKKLGMRAMLRVARKLVRDLLTKRILGGMVPVAGVIVSSTLSWMTVSSLTKAAEEFYTAKRDEGR